MWFKILGSALILYATTSYGFMKAQGYQNRTIQLRYFQDAFAILQSEMTYGLTPLPLALGKVGRMTKEPVAKFFENVALKLKGGEGEGMETYWTNCLREIDFSLTKEDMAIIENLGFTLGRSSVVEQKKHLDLTIKQLQMAEKESRDLCAKNEKMWKYLGFFSGLALILVLI
ncbi:stage III sporulation protein AB [Anaerobranca californiensis DSM 14826]|jgi:stage III sporulation protein AB|uniref:Stage III sporulation protein AB n=1 Tax=Anaerobranca californiensis DSM 14826 TaxID=1120989 RepID=A0A1M6L880_9FIRM|nr:stage III sporulation protein SpoIIIAB [Anaerobranca californiensis]SHJ67259.1 stage III sporulation protein AB [Anaerobranca californiensis DSM 14826]